MGKCSERSTLSSLSSLPPPISHHQTSDPPDKHYSLPHGILGEEDDADTDAVQDTKTVVGVEEVGGGSEVVPDLNKNRRVASRSKVDLHGHQRKECEIDIED